MLIILDGKTLKTALIDMSLATGPVVGMHLSMLLMRITNVERASRPVHRSVGPGDPTYTTVVVLLVCVSETHRRKLLMPPSTVGCNTKCQWLGTNW